MGSSDRDSSGPDKPYGSRRSAAAADRIERSCRTIVAGRRASRALTQWIRRFALSEAEFQVLWRLRKSADDGLDQTTLARELAVSPAQVSTTVERLRVRGWTEPQIRPDDRRRHLWQLTATGQALIDAALRDASQLEPVLYESADSRRPRNASSQKEAA